MNQTVKTLLFVAAAAACMAIAAGTYFSNQPADIADFSDVGEQFFPKFEDPSTATALRVAAYNSTTGKTEVFKVENRDGLWQIPSHHDYPADGKDRLGKTAASMIGVVRQALVERSQSAQKRFGLLDPLGDDLTSTEGRGNRITLYKGDDILVDLIVGKPVENSSNLFYVRRADEDRIYTADLGNLNISTKFADWIEKDILQVNSAEIRDVLISRYSVDEAQGRVIPEGQIELNRENGEGSWNLSGLNPQTEKVKLSEVNSLLQALTDLKIVGVRQKPEALIAGLKSAEGKISLTALTLRDLQQKGVFIDRERGEFVYNEGKVNVGTNDGVVYELGFGEEFSGSDLDIEIGGQKSAEEEAKELEQETKDQTASNSDEKEAGEKPADSAETDGAKTDGAKTDGAGTDKDEDNSAEDSAKPGQKKSRYLFVTVVFDKSLLGPAPVKPVAPKKPAAASEKKAEESESTAKEDKETPNSSEPADDNKPEDKEKSDVTADKPEQADKSGKPDADKSKTDKVDPQKAYEEALKEYELQKEVYETQKKAYAEKLKAGEKRVADLSARFAEWYYVISEDVFDKLKLKREALVEPAKAENAETPGSGASASGTPALETPFDNVAPPAASKSEAMPADKSAADKPAAEKPATEKPAAEKPVGDKPDENSAESKPAEPKPEKPAEADAPQPGDSKSPSPATEKPVTEKPAPEGTPE